MNRRLLCLLLVTAPALARRQENAETCARLDARLREIQSRRRAGYRAAQGRKLRDRQIRLEQQRREGCR